MCQRSAEAPAAAQGLHCVTGDWSLEIKCIIYFQQRAFSECNIDNTAWPRLQFISRLSSVVKIISPVPVLGLSGISPNTHNNDLMLPSQAQASCPEPALFPAPRAARRAGSYGPAMAAVACAAQDQRRPQAVASAARRGPQLRSPPRSRVPLGGILRPLVWANGEREGGRP